MCWCYCLLPLLLLLRIPLPIHRPLPHLHPATAARAAAANCTPDRAGPLTATAAARTQRSALTSYTPDKPAVDCEKAAERTALRGVHGSRLACLGQPSLAAACALSMQRILQLSADDYLPAPCPLPTAHCLVHYLLLLARLLHSPSPPASPSPPPPRPLSSPLHCIAPRPLRHLVVSAVSSLLSTSVSLSLHLVPLRLCPALPVSPPPSPSLCARASRPVCPPGLAPAFPARSPISLLSGWSAAH